VLSTFCEILRILRFLSVLLSDGFEVYQSEAKFISKKD